jgi:iron complex outermembrane receptor protein
VRANRVKINSQISTPFTLEQSKEDVTNGANRTLPVVGFLEIHMNRPAYLRCSVLALAAARVCWLSLSMFAMWTAHAQEEPRSLPLVEITGSSIKRVADETALPVQTFTRKQIEQTGATNTTDLIQKLPAMQASTVEGSAVGGETYGFSGVSIHSIGETRTVVLLNGHRIAKSGGQTVTGSLGASLNPLGIFKP